MDTENKLHKLTPEALAGRSFPKQKILPPIMSENDKALLQDIRQFVDKEKKTVGVGENETSPQKFAIYSEAFDRLINHVTVYKDILADIKREYEESIVAIQNGQNESAFMQSKIKSLSCLPVTLGNYRRRKEDLEAKLNILTESNKTLEEKLKNLKKIEDVNEESELPSVVEVTPQEESSEVYEEKRPIPGLTVQQWTDEKTLQEAVSQLNQAIKDFLYKQKTSYVPMAKKIETDQMLAERMKTRTKCIEDGKRLKRKNVRLKLAIDAMKMFKKKKEEDPEFNKDLKTFMSDVFANVAPLQRQASWISDSGQFSAEEDDPSKEKEAEMILEYIDKFNELFTEKEFGKAAIHAASSPRGILRTMETLNRFREVSLNFPGAPSPLLLYAEALMHSSSSQENKVDGEISTVCTRCALNENRPDLVEHWLSKGCLTLSEELGEMLVQYSAINDQHRDVCLTMALKLFTDLSCHMWACMTYYQLSHLGSLVDYAKNTANFNKKEYLEMLKCCPEPSLVWSLCRHAAPSPEMTSHSHVTPVLPLRFDEAILALASTSQPGQNPAAIFMDDVYNASLLFAEDDEGNERVAGRMDSPDSLHKIIYHEIDPSLVDENDCDWSSIADFCTNQNLPEVAIEIRAAIVVKISITRALEVIAQHEKEQFDYYT